MEPVFELKLVGAAEAPGEVRLVSLGPLATALQEVVARLGRLLDDRTGPGRAPAVIESLTRLTLVGVRQSSTALDIRRGDDTALTLGVGLDQQIDDRFIELVEGVRAGSRPEWTTPALADSVSRLVDALCAAAPRVSLSFPGRTPVEMVATELDKGVWQAAALRMTTKVVAVGRLEAVDLDTATFRVRDDVGNGISLRRVDDAGDAARYVGERVRATGTAVRDDEGRVKRLVDVVIEPAPLPASWTSSAVTDVAAIISSAPGPDPDGGVELTDEEFESFLRAVHG